MILRSNPTRDEECIKKTIEDEQSVLFVSDRTKNQKYQNKCMENGISFCPIVLSAFGGVHKIGYEVGINFMISKTRTKGFKSTNWAAPNRHSYWLQTYRDSAVGR